MANNTIPKNVLQIHIPPRTKNTCLNQLEILLNDKKELTEEIKNNNNGINKEQIEYLFSLLNLESSPFEKDELNKDLLSNPLFFTVVRHNLYEGTLKTFKQIDSINKDNIFFKLAIPDHKWLEITGYTDSSLTAINLLEFELFSEGFEITICDSTEFDNIVEARLREHHKKIGKSKENSEFWIKENKQKRELISIVTKTLLSKWNITDFDNESVYDEKTKVKSLSWCNIYKHDID